MGGLPGFGDDDFVAHEQVAVLGPIHMVPKEHPKQRGPRDDRCEKALHRPITAPWTSPPGQAQHRHTPRHDYHRQSNAAALTQRCPRDGGVEALQTCYHVHRGLPVGLALSLWQTTTL